jgi:hypothetical protein
VYGIGGIATDSLLLSMGSLVGMFFLVFFLLLFVELGLELRLYSLSHSAIAFL